MTAPGGASLQRDDYFSSSVTLFEVPDGLGDLGQRVGPVDHRLHFSGLHQVPQQREVVFPDVRYEKEKFLAAEWRAEKRFDWIRHRPDPATAVWSSPSDQDRNAVWDECAPQFREGMVSHRVVNDVVSLSAPG